MNAMEAYLATREAVADHEPKWLTARIADAAAVGATLISVGTKEHPKLSVQEVGWLLMAGYNVVQNDIDIINGLRTEHHTTTFVSWITPASP